jgi:hypothetical protein
MIGPRRWIASSAYSEHVGKNRHVGARFNPDR